MKKIGFVLPSLTISGGIHIVLRWSFIINKHKLADSYIIVPDFHGNSTIPFLKPEEAAHIKIISLSQAYFLSFDFIFATWWLTIKDAIDLRTSGIGLFLQAFEGQFYPWNDREQYLFEIIIQSCPYILTISNWLQQTVSSMKKGAGRVECILNPLDFLFWHEKIPRFPKNLSKPRFLIEGPVSDTRKNIPQTIEIFERLGVEYIWVGANTEKHMVGDNCIAVLDKVKYEDMPSVYHSCDVLVKLSTAEGMFGPPLEMFACGGTAIVFDVEGSEEYMTHMYNSILVPMNDFYSVEQWIIRISDDKALLLKLKENAFASARRIPSWEQAVDQMKAVIDTLPHNQSIAFKREVFRLNTGISKESDTCGLDEHLFIIRILIIILRRLEQTKFFRLVGWFDRLIYSCYKNLKAICIILINKMRR